MTLALPDEMRQILNTTMWNDFALYLAAFIAVLLISLVWYFLHVYKPYAKFPTCRLEPRILYWVLKRIPINYGVMQTFIEQARRYESEGIFAIWLGSPYLFVYKEEITKKMLNEPTATDKPYCYNLFAHITGNGILTSNGEVYKKQWKMAAPAFHATALKTFPTIMNIYSEDLVERLSALNGQPTDDIINIVAICAIKVLNGTNLGEKEKNAEEFKQVIKVFNKVTEFMIKRLWSPWLYFDFALPFSSLAREVRELTTNILRDSLKPRLEQTKASLLSQQASSQTPVRELNGKKLKTFGESFVEQHLKDPTITMDEVARQLLVVFGAGFDTVTVTVTYALFLLGQHEDVQDRAFQEIVSETEGHISYDDLQRLSYLDCVIKETTRLYPAVPLFGRKIRKELQCGEIKLPKNSSVFVFSYMLHRNPEIYPDPEKFNPDRFLEKDSKIKPWNFIPFAEGLRPCIGKNYSMVLMKIILAHVLRNFRIVSFGRMEEGDISWSVILNFTKKLQIQFLPRITSN